MNIVCFMSTLHLVLQKELFYDLFYYTIQHPDLFVWAIGIAGSVFQLQPTHPPNCAVSVMCQDFLESFRVNITNADMK